MTKFYLLHADNIHIEFSFDFYYQLSICHTLRIMSAGLSALSESVSQRIAMARVLCIVGMIYVHVPSGENAATAGLLDLSSGFNAFQAFVVEGFGRASACLLSIVSGFLTFRALKKPRSSVRALYKRRFATIVVPMMLWSSITVVIYAIVSLSRTTFLQIEGDGIEVVLAYLNFLVFLTDMPVGATMHLAFLRDLFVCVLLSPFLLVALNRAAAATLLLLLFVYLIDFRESLIILRPLVLLGFALGMWIALRRFRLNALDAYWAWWITLSVAGACLIMLFNAGMLPALDQSFARHGYDAKDSLLYPVTRLFGTLAVWTLTAQLLDNRLKKVLMPLTPYIFVAFCSHYVVLTLLYFSLWQPLFGDSGGLLYPVWFVAAPALSIAIALVMIQVLATWFPSLARQLSGGRMIPSMRQWRWVAERR